MPQCKKSNCREPAVYNRRWGHKRYCETHGHAYADRRDKALAVRAKLPDCESGISASCEGKVSPQRAERGETVCRYCDEEMQDQRREQDYQSRKIIMFERAETVEDLKDWIREFDQ